MESDPGSQGLLPLAPSFLLACDISHKTIELGSQEHQRHDDIMGIGGGCSGGSGPGAKRQNSRRNFLGIFSEVKAQPINGAIIAKPLLNNQLQTILFSDQEITHSRQIC